MVQSWLKHTLSWKWERAAFPIVAKALQKYRRKTLMRKRCVVEACELIRAGLNEAGMRADQQVRERLGAIEIRYDRNTWLAIPMSHSVLKLRPRSQQWFERLEFALTHRALVVRAHRMEVALSRMLQTLERGYPYQDDEVRIPKVKFMARRLALLCLWVSSLYDLCHPSTFLSVRAITRARLRKY